VCGIDKSPNVLLSRKKTCHGKQSGDKTNHFSRNAAKAPLYIPGLDDILEGGKREVNELLGRAAATVSERLCRKLERQLDGSPPLKETEK
jgi:hypothetical protein